MSDNYGMGEQPDNANRASIGWLLVFLVYLFIVANSLFTGLFEELEDHTGHTYRPQTDADVGEDVVALVATLGPVLYGAWWWRKHTPSLDAIGAEERLIVQLLIGLVIAAALRAALALALRLDRAGPALEAVILGVQIAAGAALVGGGLRLLSRNIQAQDDDAPTS